MFITIIAGIASAMFMILAFCLGVSVTEKIYSRAGSLPGEGKQKTAPEQGSESSSRNGSERLEPVIPAVPDPEKKQRYEEERRAFDTCMKYNSEMAYERCGKI